MIIFKEIMIGFFLNKTFQFSSSMENCNFNRYVERKLENMCFNFQKLFFKQILRNDLSDMTHDS